MRPDLSISHGLVLIGCILRFKSILRIGVAMLDSVRKHVFGDVGVGKTKKKRIYNESREQGMVVSYLRKNHPEVLVMRLENALKRTPAQYMRDFNRGMFPGAPDLLLITNGNDS